MKEAFSQWLQDTSFPEGVHAGVVRFPDQTASTRAASAVLEPGALENAARCAGDVFRVLKVHRLPAGRLQWAYTQARVHCLRRPDDIILVLIAEHGADVEPLFTAFSSL